MSSAVFQGLRWKFQAKCSSNNVEKSIRSIERGGWVLKLIKIIENCGTLPHMHFHCMQTAVKLACISQGIDDHSLIDWSWMLEIVCMCVFVLVWISVYVCVGVCILACVRQGHSCWNSFCFAGFYLGFLIHMRNIWVYVIILKYFEFMIDFIKIFFLFCMF